MHWLVISQQNKIGYYTYTSSFTCDVLINFCAHFLLYLSIYPFILFSFNCIIKGSIFLSIFENHCQYSSESYLVFPGIFLTIPRRTFPGILWNIPRNPLEHSQESSSTFPGILWNIPWNVKIITFPEYSKRFPGILVNIPRVPCIPRIPFLDPVVKYFS